MLPKINCAMFIDDNSDDNYFHERVLALSGFTQTIITKERAIDALEYLKSAKEHPILHPDLIFLDINMPEMNGWEFLDEYNKLDQELKSSVIIMMLNTYENQSDKVKRLSYDVVVDCKPKPLTKEILNDIVNQYF